MVKGGDEDEVVVAQAVLELPAEADFVEIAAKTAGFSGADMQGLAREAAHAPLREMMAAQRACGTNSPNPDDLRPVTRKDFNLALKKVKPSVAASEVLQYEAWNRSFGSADLMPPGVSVGDGEDNSQDF